MNVIKQPNFIIFGKNSINEFNFLADCLVITSKGAKKRGWLDFFKLKNYYIYDKVEPNPSIEIIDEIISDFRDSNFSHIIGLGGGSSLDVNPAVGRVLSASADTEYALINLTIE